MPTHPLPVLTLLEARVLAVLVEKERTVPDTYPMSLNALTAGCNQKTSRHPVIAATEAEVQVALDGLRRLSLAIESSGGRVMRYAHNARRVLEIPAEAVALLATLVLRGPQTAAELRINCERLHRFADGSSVEAFLRELAARDAGALVAELPRQPGAREVRWASLVCGPVAPEMPASAPSAHSGAPGDDSSLERLAALEAEVARLAAGLRELEAAVARLRTAPGVAP